MNDNEFIYGENDIERILLEYVGSNKKRRCHKMTYNVEEVREMEKEIGGKPKWFIGEMFCHECKSVVKVRYDVYLKRLLRAIEKGQTEEEMNRSYECRKCHSGVSIKKEEFFEMLKEGQ